MNTKESKVLACIDGSRYSTAVCDYSVWASQRINAPLKLLHNIEHHQIPGMVDLSGSIGLGSQEKLLDELTTLEQQRSKLLVQQGKIMLDAAKARAEQAGVKDIIAKQRHGSLTESLIELADEIRVLVLGIRGEGHENDDKQVGAHLETIIRSLHKPILVVNKAFSEPQRIMLAYDGSEAAEKALDMIAHRPLFKGLPCHVVYANPNPEKHTANCLPNAISKLEAAGVDVITAALEGKPEDAICAYQAEHQIDLIVMGAFGHTRIRELLLGSFTAKMLSATQKPLLLLR
ncbi:universal stress protein [Zooshikella marina]|uniref:universal stress protein n=1 Tax=Zooshikella ganghwensis TaxID=202772 RepID=UPI001BB06DD9|nr:universal stress protein [Zooshikella ganghwensis]MBU2706096.1 universal stress protein [Zooshikella ganghwensis]